MNIRVIDLKKCIIRNIPSTQTTVASISFLWQPCQTTLSFISKVNKTQNTKQTFFTRMLKSHTHLSYQNQLSQRKEKKLKERKGETERVSELTTNNEA